MRNLIAREFGIAMPLAMIMVVLIGVMGAGLLAFVVTDIDSVVEVNQGQRALEMAEAGVKTAKIQLQQKPDYRNYDASGDTWFDGRTITMDSYSAFVTIKKTASSTPAQPYFAVTSQSSVGQSTRKVQAIFRASGWGIKAYYTPGSIFISPDDSAVDSSGVNQEPLGLRLQDRVDIRGISLFAGRDVVISDNTTVTYARRSDTGEQRTNSVTGGGRVYDSTATTVNEWLCIYQNDPAGTAYRTNLNNNSNTCQRFFGGTGGEVDYDGNDVRFPSSWERVNAESPVQPHIRIVANAQCPEIDDQWSSSPNPPAALPSYHADPLDSWDKAPFNVFPRPQDQTQNWTNSSHGSSTPAPCQDYTGENEAGSGDLGLDPYPSSGEQYQPASIAAEGLICRAGQATTSPETYTDKNLDSSGSLVTPPVTTGYGCSNSATSIATFRVGDIRGGAERIGYDSSTTPRFYDKKDKGPTGTTASSSAPSGWTSDLSYPFDPDQGPDVEGLYDLANSQGRYKNGVPTNAEWSAFYPPSGRNNRVVVFIDANGKDITIPRDSELANSEDTRGVLVVRCGNLTNMRNRFNGIVLVLNDPGPSDDTSTEQTRCRTGTGNYRSSKPRRGETGPTDVGGFVYAEGYGQAAAATNTANVNGSDVDPKDGVPDFRYSITIADASDINRLPRGPGYDDLTEIVGSGLEGVQLQSWRECYNDNCIIP